VDLMGGPRTFTVADASGAVDLDVDPAVVSGSLIKSGAGTMRLAGANTYTGATTVSAGKLVLAQSLTTSNGVTVRGGTLELAAGGSSNRVIRTGAVSITGTGTLEISDNKLIVTGTGGDVGTFDGQRYTGLTGLIASAYNFSSWDGPGITTSMPDAGPTKALTTLAIGNAEDTFYAGGTFGGVPVTSGDVLVMYTYAGDLNLDGLIDGADYGVIDNWVQFPGSSGYANGDINYDGVIDGADYGVIDNAVQLQGAPFPSGTYGAAGAGLAGVAAVPEPAAGGGLMMIAVGLLLRLRRRPPGRARRPRGRGDDE
jgi:autotransporter-associated beta strand protein